MWFWLSTAAAATLSIGPGDDFAAALEGLQPGDEVVVQAGTYPLNGGSGSYFNAVALYGTADAPIVVRAAEGAAVLLEGDPAGSQNALNLSGEHFVFSGFEIAYGSHGVRLDSSAHAVLEDLYVHDTADVGVSANIPGATYQDITWRGIEIADTAGTGECFYLGCNDGDCVVFDSVVEFNWCHDTLGGTQGDGIELKTGSYGNSIRHNVIQNTRYPGITAYGTGGLAPNEIIGNHVHTTLDSGIQVVGDVLVAGNVVIDARYYGIFAKSSQGNDPTALTIVHNTVVDTDGDSNLACLRTNDLGAGAADVVIANNALYCPGGVAMRLNGGEAFATVQANLVEGSLDFTATTQATEADLGFVDLDGGDLYPSADSDAVDFGGVATAATADFNCLAWDAAPDAGAYDRGSGDNPGWRPGDGFKTCAEADEAGDTGAGAGDTGTGARDTGTGAGDTGTETDSGLGDPDDGTNQDETHPDGGCGCAGVRGSGGWLVALLAAGWRRRTVADG